MSLDCATCLQPPEACHLCPRAWAPLCPVCEQPGHAASECPWVLEAGEVPGVTGRAMGLDWGESLECFMPQPSTNTTNCPWSNNYERLIGRTPHEHGQESDPAKTISESV